MEHQVFELQGIRRDLQRQLDLAQDHAQHALDTAKSISEQFCAINANITAIRRQIGFISFVVFVAAFVWLIPAVDSWLSPGLRSVESWLRF
jgi:hypothetical protein